MVVVLNEPLACEMTAIFFFLHNRMYTYVCAKGIGRDVSCNGLVLQACTKW